jgi:hypothetical protein
VTSIVPDSSVISVSLLYFLVTCITQMLQLSFAKDRSANGFSVAKTVELR